MFTFILCLALLNVVGGRNLLGEEVGGERLICRVLLPTLCVFFVAMEMLGVYQSIMVSFAYAFGSLLWAVPGWSFDEINGKYDGRKYPLIIRKIGVSVFPDFTPEINRYRGALMKGLRGLYEYPGYVLLATINPIALLYGLGSALMGVIYFACGKIVRHERYAVIASEFTYGAFRAFLFWQVMRAL